MAVTAVGAIEVRTATSGTGLDSDGYDLVLDDGAQARGMAPTDAITFGGLRPDDHRLELTGVAEQCTVEGQNPRTVRVTEGDTARTSYAVTCTGEGSIKTVVVTDGEDRDFDGYTVTVGDTVLLTGVTDSVTLERLVPGQHSVALGDIAANCSTAAGAQETATVAHGDTTRVEFGLSCERMIAFASRRGETSVADIYLVTPDGTLVTQVTTDPASDNAPSRSGDARRIAFSSNRSDPSGGTSDIFTVEHDGSNVERVTTDPSDEGFPARSPDGTRIAFVRIEDGTRNIYVVNSDGTDVRPLVKSADRDDSPSWSPDGSRIAFSSDRGGNQDIYVIGVDGSNLVRLTADPARDGDPAWSPDGSQIAFHSDRKDAVGEIFVMKADGSNERQVTPSGNTVEEAQPSWSPDGTWIVFLATRVGFSGIHKIRTDGMDRRELTSSGEFDDSRPAWAN